jgi:hypothetical protein
MPLGSRLIESLQRPEDGLCGECRKNIGIRFPYWVAGGGVRFVCEPCYIKLEGHKPTSWKKGLPKNIKYKKSNIDFSDEYMFSSLLQEE